MVQIFVNGMHLLPIERMTCESFNNAWRLKLYLFKKKQTTPARHFIITSRYILKVKIKNPRFRVTRHACYI